MVRKTLVIAALISAAAAASAQDVKDVEENGILYRETRQVVKQVIPDTRLEERDFTIMEQNVSTEIKEVDRVYPVPVTEYQWVPYWQRSLNPFSQPFLAYRQVAVTRWENRSERVRVPITTRQPPTPKVVKQSVPVTQNIIAERIQVTRVPIRVTNPALARANAPAGAPLMSMRSAGTTTGSSPPQLSGAVDPFAQGSRPTMADPTLGGVNRFESDPPREGSSWRSSDPGLRR